MRIKTSKNIFVSILVTMMLVIVSGCSKGIERVSIDGVVTFEGKPLDGGYVTIKPKLGPGAGTEIKPDGSYKILKAAGPMAGECEISVERFEYRTEKGSDGRDSTIPIPKLPDQIQGKPKPFTLTNGNNKINIDLDKW
ncbi:MAG: hypothetical protein LBT09_09075 [Planctomycetaceae bacterium]|jgi:hypothetical protein|nr:hypothetical protein [Planctomycetaceae bacterium]